MRARAAISAFLLLGLATGAAGGAMISSPSGIDDRLRLEWQAEASRNGRAVISGYLYNDYKRPATKIVLLVESQDAQGQVISRAIGFVPDTVPAWSRGYFEIPLKSTGATYRISVTSFEWYSGSG